jgi:Raf kinase inhibitor-like YbhB/YbcL family protein
MHKRALLLASFLILSITIASCAPSPSVPTVTVPLAGEKGETLFALGSKAFAPQAMIPPRYTCDGTGISPPLQWEHAPAGTASLALIVDDPDAPAGTWVHWVIYGLPPEPRELAESSSANAELPNGARQGKNSSGSLGYVGPCPPSGTHRYFFKLYALDTMMLGLAAGMTKEQLLQAMEGHILGQAELVGVYTRQ